ncbi:Serine/threonine-protein kinase haspin hrk1 [Cladorrhinum samala]|uniref:non-specific serine/threonine protein kinase n=1 Tax=Cladorrhinum samala TaxID=585594 RepID=A0AAV9H6L9_9PEZI|nr:Serine/threonine-protein kinase haspin hrk1 [Cladorrhinum samala]
MPRTTAARKYGKSTRNTRAEQLFAELPQSPAVVNKKSDIVEITQKLVSVTIEPAEVEEEVGKEEEEKTVILEERTRPSTPSSVCSSAGQRSGTSTRETTPPEQPEEVESPLPESLHKSPKEPLPQPEADGSCVEDPSYLSTSSESLRILTWDDICPFGDQITKIAEASYAEVYRITNDRGTSIIKCVRLESPIKPQTKAQERSGLVDEEPHSPESMLGELKISEWLADIPGFVVYKERYIVRGKAPKSLLETHQAFHRKEKRKDPDRLQFYPSPSRYLDDTEFLVVELGDAGIALEDFALESIDQVWDIFLHAAIALARAEDLIQFEHRDLHEGNLCIRQVRPPSRKPTMTTTTTTTTTAAAAAAATSSPSSATCFGFSGLEITILDYGLSRASPCNPPPPDDDPIFYDLESDLSVFTSTHAAQCAVYRRMRSFLLRGDRVNPLPAPKHSVPYAKCSTTGEPISWEGYFPYTNVLWLSYIYSYLTSNFKGDPKVLKEFKRDTRELRLHLDPGAPKGVLSFPCAGDVVRFALEAGWVGETQLMEDSSGWLGGPGGGGVREKMKYAACGGMIPGP